MSSVVFVPLAANQVRFYALVADEMRRLGFRPIFISLHEPSVDDLATRGFEVLNFFSYLRTPNRDLATGTRHLADHYGIDNLARLISHEKVTYGIRDTSYLLRKLIAYVDAMERILDRVGVRAPTPPVITQELGGFLSVAAVFYVARARGWDNVFVEPSFFRGRVLFLRNTFAALRIGPSTNPVSPEVRQYLDSALRTQQLVIPAKDTAHYRSVVRKITSLYNMRRLVEKAMQKYVRLQREEFTHLGTQVRRHVQMLVLDSLLRGYARDLPPDKKFVYYPLHVWTDVALTIRAPEYLDQYWLLDYVARNIPQTHVLVFKEHPAMVGGLSYWRVRELLQRHDNIILIRPWINNYRVMQAADAVITVNSKSGAEAILLGKPVLSLGDSFYRNSGLAVVVHAPEEIPKALAQALTSPRADRTLIEEFFQAVWDNSYPGELYVDTPQGARIFADSLARFLTDRRLEVADDVQPQKRSGYRTV